MKKENFSFSMVPNVPANAEFHFFYDDKITCKRKGKTEKVRYSGGNYSLSSAAQAAYKSIYGKDTNLCGPKYWLYNGKTLDEWREENLMTLELTKEDVKNLRYFFLDEDNRIEPYNIDNIVEKIENLWKEIKSDGGSNG